MIIKKCYRKHGKSIRDLINYLNTGNNENRVTEMGYRNIELTDPSLVALEMMTFTVCSKIKRKNMSHYGHYIISWKAEEDERIPKMNELVEYFCKATNFDKCQCFWVKHGDTNNAHVHIVINRVDPVEKTIVLLENAAKFEINKLNECRIKMEIEYGLNKRNVKKQDIANEIIVNELLQKEHKKNTLMKITKKEIKLVKDIIDGSDNWEEIERRLEENGWCYCRHNNTNEIAIVNKNKETYLSINQLGQAYSPENVLKRLDAVEQRKKTKRHKKSEIEV